uniref:Uncharacterized protein n=1 Tax=Anguilla anguilla TaxID=7936 RepID=A0A0E9WJD9_ANGAN
MLRHPAPSRIFILYGPGAFQCVEFFCLALMMSFVVVFRF